MIVRGNRVRLLLSEDDVSVVLEALGSLIHTKYDSRRSSERVEKVINKVYRAMGVREGL